METKTTNNEIKNVIINDRPTVVITPNSQPDVIDCLWDEYIPNIIDCLDNLETLDPHHAFRNLHAHISTINIHSSDYHGNINLYITIDQEAIIKDQGFAPYSTLMDDFILDNAKVIFRELRKCLQDDCTGSDAGYTTPLGISYTMTNHF